MAKINKVSEELQMPSKEGWYWVQLDGYYDGPKWFPCWYQGEGCFLPGGIGDSSSNGIFLEDGILQVGPEILEPTN
jgi:hypothetical protein